MYRKYFVYVDDGDGIMKIAICAVCEEAAALSCAGAGDVIKVVDVTDRYHIRQDKVYLALHLAGFSDEEIRFMIRALNEFGIIE